MRRPPLRTTALLLIVVAGLGCQRFTKEAADREVYGLLAEGRECVPELSGSLHVEAEDAIAESLRRREAYVLGVDDAVALAMVTRREYRTQREDVYLAALDLTFQRQQFRPLFSGGAGGGFSFDEEGTDIDGAADWSVTRALATGGSVVLSIATDFLTALTGNSTLRTAQTLIDAEIAVPLLRGAGRFVTLEPLRQAERDTLYALRGFARDQQVLRVDIATRVYDTLALQDTLENEERAYESLQRLVDEQAERAKAGEIREFEVDLARQDLLTADERRLRARRRLSQALDQLKLDLGIPMAAELEVDTAELVALRESGLGAVPYELDEAIELAGEKRLDLKNERGREQDAMRQVKIAVDDLKASVDLVVSGSLDTPGEQPWNIAEGDPTGSVGLDLDLPLERTAERNAYVRARISAMRARRDRQRLEDLVDFQVRNAWRSLLEARRSFEIQKEGVRLSERRVESTALLLQEGSADIRDRLDAEDARVEARNRLTAALVDYALALLELERDVGTLAVSAPDAAAIGANGFPPPEPEPTADAAGAAPADENAPADK
ncbi:MAG: TolC family protein [Planctomycetota bacterium]|nr:TolC family protein [Planctomycetota bacterium]